MAYKAVILPGARQDIKDAALWYNEQREGLGKRFLESVKREVRLMTKIHTCMKFDMMMSVPH